MKKDPLVFLKHIVESIEAIESFSKDTSIESLKENRLKQSAIVRELEIIGEAAKNLPSDFKNKHSDIKWKQIAGLRDKLIHHYFGIDLSVIWDIIQVDLPKLKEQIKEILENVR
jgi:uncharacterized protein with HEPN domain